MCEPAIDSDVWMDELPLVYVSQVTAPAVFESHVDAPSYSRKLVGRDQAGRRCYVMHLHTEVEERFDIDEFPLEVAVGRERHIAWRLRSGHWLVQVDRLHRLDSCCPQLEHHPPVEVTERQLGL